MKTREEIEQIVKELREVCDRHAVSLLPVGLDFGRHLGHLLIIDNQDGDTPTNEDGDSLEQIDPPQTHQQIYDYSVMAIGTTWR